MPQFLKYLLSVLICALCTLAPLQEAHAQANADFPPLPRICIVPGVPINCVPEPPTTTVPILTPLPLYKCPYSRDVVILHSVNGFSGDCVSKGPGDYRNSLQMGLNDNSISSITVGENMHMVACAEPNFHGNCDFFEGRFSANRLERIVPFGAGSGGALTTNPERLREYRERERKYYEDQIDNLDQLGEGYAITTVGGDNISSFYIRRKQCADVDAGITVYAENEYYGLCRDFAIGDEFNHRNLPLFGKNNARHIPSIEMKSFIVISGRSGVQVCFCKDRSMAGGCKIGFYSRASKDIVSRVDKFNLEEYGYVVVQAYGHSCPSESNSVPPTIGLGFQAVRVYNCHSDKRPLEVWIRSKRGGQAVNSEYRFVASIPHLWTNGSCPVGEPWTYSLSDGEVYDFAFVDSDSPFCSGAAHPNQHGCVRFRQSNIRGGVSAASEVMNVR